VSHGRFYNSIHKGYIDMLFRTLTIIIGTAFCLTSLPVSAQEVQPGDLEQIDSCLESTDDLDMCIGHISVPCIQAPNGGSTIGTMNCRLREYKTWDIVLNREYKVTRNAFKAADESGDVLNPDLLRTDALLKAQRAWITFRDEECGLAYIRWGKGSFRQVAGADCLMHLTAERAIDLIEMQPF
jgi:uncharacterized protein YecT (DUF1311 family)